MYTTTATWREDPIEGGGGFCDSTGEKRQSCRETRSGRPVQVIVARTHLNRDTFVGSPKPHAIGAIEN